MIKFNLLLLVLLLFVACKEKSIQKEMIIEEGNVVEYELEPDVVELELQYFGMMCSCPQWATKENIQKYEASIHRGNPIPMDSLFVLIEPKDESVAGPAFLLNENKTYL